MCNRAMCRGVVSGRLILLGLGLVLAGAWPARAQWPRYELGRRVRAFERTWADTSDAQAQRRAAESLNQAVRSFFGMAFGEAARNITQAAHQLKSGDPLDPTRAWAGSLAIEPGTRLLDVMATALPLRLEAFYRVGDAIPPQAQAQVSLRAAGAGVDAPPVATITQAVTELPLRFELPLDRPPLGDHLLVTEILVAGQVQSRLEAIVAVVEQRDARLAAIRTAAAAWPETPQTTERASARLLLDRLGRLAGGQTLELDVPAARRLADCEAIVAADQAAARFFAPEHAGDFWVALSTPDGRRSVPCRLLVPDGLEVDAPRPLVIALHGAGGSENLFFESYGAGAIVRECGQRGWFLVAPRSALGSAPLEELVAELATRYPIDRQRVFVVGHSMGAAQAVAATTRDPGRFAALAALGGGGRPQKPPGVERLPAFVGVGDRDFALEGARGLAESLKAAGLAELVYREYPGIEHLAIVQVALPEVFAFFDRHAGTGRKP